jgi:hypothetical protein
VASYQDLLDAIARVGAGTGDNRAWMTGLSDTDLALVTSPVNVVSPNAIDNVVAKIRTLHRQVFDPASPAAPSPEVGEGRAADAIRTAETSLAQQHSVSAQLDLQVIAAVLNAHTTHAAGRQSLDGLQDDIETAVATRTDLDTPAGARAFQRYLIGKLRDIKAVVETAGLDDTSKASLAAALASLYVGATPDATDEHAPTPKPPAPPAENQLPAADLPAVGTDPLDDALLPEDFAAPPPDPSAASQPMSAPMIPPMAGIPAFGGGTSPAMGPAPMPPTLDNLTSPRSLTEDSLLDDPMPDDPVDDGEEAPAAEADDEAAGEEPTTPASNDATIVHLPNGETVTAPSPQVAAAITAAVAGTPIPEAFHQQGITIPAPGSAVPHPIEPARVIAGDIGMLTDRHALALGNGKAVFNNQIQPIASVNGPSFLGWEHPPEPGSATSTPRATQQAQSDQPTPTRPAVTAGPPIGE